MSSVLFFEQPGRWRAIVTASLLLVLALPLAPMALAAFGGGSTVVGDAFWTAFLTSGEIAFAAGAIGFAAGLPLGVGTALAPFPGRWVVLSGVMLPLVVPSFLWAIGWSNLSTYAPLSKPLTRGLSGCVLVAATMTTALVMLASYAATLELSRSQLEAALLAGGERSLFRRAGRNAVVPAAFAAALGAVLSLSDPGAGQILGTHTVATEILTTFAAQYDLALAARQCLVLTLVVATVTLPLAWYAGPRLAHAILARQIAAPLRERRNRTRAFAALGGGALLLLTVVPPIVALLLPLLLGEGEVSPIFSSEEWKGNHRALLLIGALGTFARTASNSVVYAIGAGVIAGCLAFATALAVGRSTRLRAVALGGCIVLFSSPAAAGALGIAHLAAAAPPALDFFLRSRFTVSLALALHLAPLAAALAMRAAGAIPPSWTYAAAVHGVPLRHYVRSVLWPALRPSAALAVAVIALLASADAGSVLLLHPAGEPSLSLAIFTVMANAPEAQVAALCLIYLLGACTLLAASVGVATWSRRG